MRDDIGRVVIEVRSKIAFVQEKILKYMMDVKLVRGLKMGISDHYVVMQNKISGGMDRRERNQEVGKIMSKYLNKQGCKEKCVRALAKNRLCKQKETKSGSNPKKNVSSEVWNEMMLATKNKQGGTDYDKANNEVLKGKYGKVQGGNWKTKLHSWKGRGKKKRKEKGK